MILCIMPNKTIHIISKSPSLVNCYHYLKTNYHYHTYKLVTETQSFKTFLAFALITENICFLCKAPLIPIAYLCGRKVLYFKSKSKWLTIEAIFRLKSRQARLVQDLTKRKGGNYKVIYDTRMFSEGKGEEEPPQIRRRFLLYWHALNLQPMTTPIIVKHLTNLLAASWSV